MFTAETQRRREEQEELKKNLQPENAEMAESAEKTLFFNSLRLCVSAVIFRSWRGAARDFSPRRRGGAEKTLFFYSYSASLRLCVSAVIFGS
jgi:hypothetical protein